ncbi:MAG: hypothetical protein K2H98_04410 [Duncaniella sp.]|nr:hypothetical protein [Duncaniella sp.]
MADNYLEKKMEEHRSRMAAGASRRRRHVPVTGAGPLVFPERRILVSGEGYPWLNEMVTALRAAGHRVAFMDPAGNALAQATGARCYPWTSDRLADAESDILKHWGGLDITVSATRGGDILVEDLTDGTMATVATHSGADAVSAVVILTHPSSRLIHRCKTLDGE